ncbi:hypothetical protein JCM16303_004624 [Sporobolomyces ruberrimus]
MSNSSTPLLHLSADHPSLSSERPKRRSATTFEHSDQEEDDYPKPRSKRNRTQRAGSPLDDFEGAGTAEGISSEYAGGSRGQGGPAPKALSEKEKDARRQARMIRNRNAAQASRDRKKEHTLYLERRVAELEARLNGGGAHSLSISTTPFTASSGTASGSPSKLARSQRSNSVTSSISSHEATRLADLEEENDVLRTQLDLEQTESARLRARVESLETSATSSTPFPSFEPTFAFNTADLKPLPQPEELAFVEQRERQKRFGTSASSPPLSIAQIPLPSLPSTSSTSPESTRGRIIPAAEAVQLSLSSSSSTSTSLTRSPSLSASISSTPSSVASLDLASTPPSTESYLEDLDDLAPPPMWNEWVKSDPESKEDDSAVTAGLAFIDFDFLHDGPVIASC